MSLLEHGSMVDLAVAVKKSELEASIRNTKKMGFSGFLILSSRVLDSLSLSLLQETPHCTNGQGSDNLKTGLEISGLIEDESLFYHWLSSSFRRE